MTKLNTYHPFAFFAEKPKKPVENNCGLAWIDDSFHLHGDNYYVYTCHACQTKQIKKGKQPKEVLNWGGNYE